MVYHNIICHDTSIQTFSFMYICVTADIIQFDGHYLSLDAWWGNLYLVPLLQRTEDIAIKCLKCSFQS